MDIFTMLQNATIVDMETDEPIGMAIGFQVINGRMRITVGLFVEDDEDNDPDDGDKEDIPEDDASNLVQNIHAIAGGKLG